MIERLRALNKLLNIKIFKLAITTHMPYVIVPLSQNPIANPYWDGKLMSNDK